MRAFFLTDKGVETISNHLEAMAEGSKVDAYGLGEDIRELAGPGSWHFIAYDVPEIRRHAPEVNPAGVIDLRAHVAGVVLTRRSDEPIEAFLEKFTGVWLADGERSVFVEGCRIEAPAITLVKDQFVLGSMIVHFDRSTTRVRVMNDCPELLRDQGPAERQAS